MLPERVRPIRVLASRAWTRSRIDGPGMSLWIEALRDGASVTVSKHLAEMERFEIHLLKVICGLLSARAARNIQFGARNL